MCEFDQHDNATSSFTKYIAILSKLPQRPRQLTAGNKILHRIYILHVSSDCCSIIITATDRGQTKYSVFATSNNDMKSNDFIRSIEQL